LFWISIAWLCRLYYSSIPYFLSFIKFINNLLISFHIFLICLRKNHFRTRFFLILVMNHSFYFSFHLTSIHVLLNKWVFFWLINEIVLYYSFRYFFLSSLVGLRIPFQFSFYKLFRITHQKVGNHFSIFKELLFIWFMILSHEDIVLFKLIFCNLPDQISSFMKHIYINIY